MILKFGFQKLKIMLDELSQANQKNLANLDKIAELNKSVLLLEETIQAFDSYRKQNNEMLQDMQLQISSIKTQTIP